MPGKRSTVRVGPLLLLFRLVPHAVAGTTSPVQTGFAVGRQRSSVRRNALRKALREAFRISPHRDSLIPRSGLTLTLMILCHKKLEWNRLRELMDRALIILVRRLKTLPVEVAGGS